MGALAPAPTARERSAYIPLEVVKMTPKQVLTSTNSIPF